MPERAPHSKERPEETCACSTASLQEFRCSGLPLDSPILQERERLKKERLAEQDEDDRNTPPASDE